MMGGGFVWAPHGYVVCANIRKYRLCLDGIHGDKQTDRMELDLT